MTRVATATVGVALLGVALLGVVLLLLGPTAGAQDGPASSAPTSSSTVSELPAAEIIPRPNSGQAPSEAGDRGGALQLLVFGLVVVGIGVGVAKLVHDSRRARPGADAG